MHATPSPDRCPSEAARQAERGAAMLTFGSLFAGIGGIDLGLERAGMRCAWQIEIDDYAQKVLAKHWPNVPRYRDVRECGAYNLARVDVLAGGFPCQPHSEAGRRRAGSDERDLWPEFLRLICELRPRWVLAENVRGLLSSDDRRYFGAILRDLAHSGYDAEWSIISACAMGATHTRERVFILAYPAEKHGTGGGSAKEAAKAEQGIKRPSGNHIQRRLPDFARLRNGGPPSPAWIEWLMGFPPGWTDLES